MASYFVERWRLSVRQACRLVDISRTVFHYRAMPSDDAEVRTALRELAQQHFPDVEFKEVTVEPHPIGDMQSMELGEAFEGPKMEGAARGLDQWHLTEPEWLEAQMPTDFRPETSHGFEL